MQKKIYVDKNLLSEIIKRSVKNVLNEGQVGMLSGEDNFSFLDYMNTWDECIGFPNTISEQELIYEFRDYQRLLKKWETVKGEYEAEGLDIDDFFEEVFLSHDPI